PVGAAIELGEPGEYSEVASDGSSWLVTSLGIGNGIGPSDDLRWQVVAADGTLGGSGSIAGAFDGYPRPRLSSTSDGLAYTIAALEGDGLFTARVGSAGDLLASKAYPTLGSPTEIAVASDGSAAFAAYTTRAPAAFYGLRIDATLAPLDPAVVALAFTVNE